MASVAFRLTSNPDPEERLEEAALWKAMKDEYGDEIVAIREDSEVLEDLPTFGRPLKNPFIAGANPVSNVLPYWQDPAFLSRAGRRFGTFEFDDAIEEVSRLHAEGLGAFIKSTRSKHAIFRIMPGEDFYDVVQDMAYSFIDGGPELMVQEDCVVEYEYRFFCIDREIVTASPIQWSLTPIDFPLREGTVFRRPDSAQAELRPDIVHALHELAKETALEMDGPHASIDCAIINGKPAIVEFNPMRLGQLGLYAADVRALASASRSLLHERSMRDQIEAPSMLLLNDTVPLPASFQIG